MDGSSKEILLNTKINNNSSIFQDKGGLQHNAVEKQLEDKQHFINIIAAPQIIDEQAEKDDKQNKQTLDQLNDKQVLGTTQMPTDLNERQISPSNQQNDSNKLLINPSQPRRRSLFGLQYDKEVKEKKKKRNSKKKVTYQSNAGRKDRKRSTLVKDDDLRGDETNGSKSRRKLTNNILEQQLKRQQTLLAEAKVEQNENDNYQERDEDASRGVNKKKSNKSTNKSDQNLASLNQNENTNDFASKKSVQLKQSSKSQNPYDDFTLEDLKILQDTIQINRQELEKELTEIQQQKQIKKQITLQPQVARKWEKVKNQLMAFTMMRKIFNDIKKYGTSMQALSISDQVIEKCRDLLEKKQEEKQLKKCLFYPESFILNVWGAIIFFLYCFTVIYNPYQIFFKPNDEIVSNSIDVQTINYSLDLLFLMDIIVKMNTAVITNAGEIIDNRKQIILRYIKGQFFFDLLLVIPFQILGIIFPVLDQQIITSQSYNKIFRIIRVPFLMSQVSLDQKIFDYFKIQTTIQRLIRFFFAVAFSIHIVGCLWVFVARIQYYDRETWISGNQIQLSDSTKVYLFSIYWCLQTLATVGFGDIHASNNAEIVFSMSWMIIGVGFYSFAIGQISKMFTNSENRKQKLTNSIYIMDEFCTQTNLPKHIKDKIRRALQYSTNKSLLSSTEKEDFFDSIPTKLKTNLAQGMFKGMITEVPFLKNKDSFFLANLLPMLQPLKLCKGDYVYKKDSYPNLVYFIIDGKVNFLIGPNDMVFKSFLAGSYFGEIEIFHQCLRLFNVRCETSCEFLTLDRDYFGELMDKFPQVEQEMFEMVQLRQELMNQSLQKIEMLLPLKETDNFWKNSQMKSFAEILNRRKTHSFLNQEENNCSKSLNIQLDDNKNNQFTNTNFKSNLNTLSPLYATQMNQDIDKRFSENQNISTSLSPIIPEAAVLSAHEAQNKKAFIYENSTQNQHSQSKINENFNAQQKGQPSIERVESFTSIGQHQFEDANLKSFTVLKKSKMEYNQQASGGSSASSRININNDSPSQSNLPVIQSTMSLKGINLVLNVFNEKQEPMLVEVYEEEVQQTKLLQSTSTSSMKNLNEPQVHSENENNLLDRNNSIKSQGNIKKIQQKYGVSTLDRIEEKNSHIDQENLSNSYITNEIVPSFSSFNMKNETNQDANSEKRQSIISRNLISDRRSSLGSKFLSQNSIKQANLKNELDLSVGSVKQKQKDKIFQQNQSFTKNNQTLQKSDSSQNNNILHIQLKKDSIIENANLLDDLLMSESIEQKSQIQKSQSFLDVNKDFLQQDSIKNKNLLKKQEGLQKNNQEIDQKDQEILKMQTQNNNQTSQQSNQIVPLKESEFSEQQSIKNFSNFSEAILLKKSDSLNYNITESQNLAISDDQSFKINISDDKSQQQNLTSEKKLSNQNSQNNSKLLSKRQDTLKLQESNEEEEQTSNKNIIFSDRLDRIYNNVNKSITSINLKVQKLQRKETLSVTSSKNRSLQEMVMIDTSPEQTPVNKRTKISFQTRVSKPTQITQNSFHTQVLDKPLNELEVNRRNKFQRFQKTQTVINTDSDEDKKLDLKNLRQTKTITNFADIGGINETDAEEPTKNNESNKNDFDIQSLHHLSKNEYVSPVSNPESPPQIYNNIEDLDLLNTNQEEKNKQQKDQKAQERRRKKIEFVSKKTKTKDIHQQKENNIKNEKTKISSSKKQSKERKKKNNFISKFNSSFEAESQDQKKNIEEENQNKKSKTKKKKQKTKKISQDGSQKLADDKQQLDKENKEIEKKSLNNITIHTEHTSKNRSLNSLNIHDMMKHIVHDDEDQHFHIERIMKTRQLYDKLASSKEFDSSEKRNRQNDGDVSSSSSSTKKYQKNNDLKDSKPKLPNLEMLRRERKLKKSQTNQFEDRIRLLKKMGSIQISPNSPQVEKYKMSYSQSILSPILNKNSEIDNFKNKNTQNISFSDMVRSVNSKPYSVDKLPEKEGNKSEKQLKLNTKKHGGRNQFSDSEAAKKKVKKIARIAVDKKQDQKTEKQKEGQVKNKYHQKEIKTLKQNVSKISHKLDSITYQYENIINLVSTLTNKLKIVQQQQQQEELEKLKNRQINDKKMPIIINKIKKSPLSLKEMDDIDKILDDLHVISHKDVLNPLSMRRRRSSSESESQEYSDKKQNLLSNMEQQGIKDFILENEN
ncbi:hypothetical protein ABPG74_000728 [Tetrahymena malaccensis]